MSRPTLNLKGKVDITPQPTTEAAEKATAPVQLGGAQEGVVTKLGNHSFDQNLPNVSYAGRPNLDASGQPSGQIQAPRSGGMISPPPTRNFK